ncbi:MAG: hypothetical protein H2060_08715 [Azoarcus sp.]|nr:hypothetical protein [Azoarcus sp.]
MRLNRLFRLLLCLALALQGIASAQFVAEPCPMEMFEATAGEGAAAHACCNDEDTRTTTGKPCKSGQECPPVPALTIVSGAVFPVPRSAGLRPVDLSDGKSIDSLDVWRPPILS